MLLLRNKCLHKRYWDSFPSFVIRLVVYLKNTAYYFWVSGARVLCSFLKIIKQSINRSNIELQTRLTDVIPTPTPPLKPLSILLVISTLSSIFEPSVWNQNDATNRLYYPHLGDLWNRWANITQLTYRFASVFCHRISGRQLHPVDIALVTPQQARGVGPILSWCWASVVDASCLLDHPLAGDNGVWSGRPVNLVLLWSVWLSSW